VSTNLTERIEIIEQFAYEISGEKREAVDIEPMLLLTATLMSIGLTLKHIHDMVERIDERTHDDR
jgi:hypothetical protein